MMNLTAANVASNLKYYRRNRVLVAVALLLLVVFGLTSIPSFLFSTNVKKFQLVEMFFSQMNMFILVFTAALGLITVSHHIRGRCVKMVITRPCPGEIWILSNFLSAALVAAVLFAGVLIVSVLLFLAWELPFQWGFAYQSAQYFLKTMIVLSYVCFLAVALHPLMAGLVVVLFNEGLFASLLTWAVAAVEHGGAGIKGLALKVLEFLLYVSYLVLPSFSPFGNRLEKVMSTYRVSMQDLKYLLFTAGYAVVLCLFFLALSGIVLKRKRLT